MASGKSGRAELPDFGPDNKAHLPQQFDFPKHEFGKPKWSGGLFRLSHKDRTDSLLNEFVKGNEHRETFLVNLSLFSHVQIFAIRMCANENFVRCINKVIYIATPLATPMA